MNVGPNAFEIETFRDRFLGKGRKTLEPVFKYAVTLVGLIPSLSEDVHLGGLEVREGPLVGTAGAAGGGGPLRLRPAFDPGVQQYFTRVIGEVQSVCVRAVAAAATSAAEVPAAAPVSRCPPGFAEVALNLGSNEVPVVVTSEAKGSATYVLRVDRGLGARAFYPAVRKPANSSRRPLADFVMVPETVRVNVAGLRTSIFRLPVAVGAKHRAGVTPLLQVEYLPARGRLHEVAEDDAGKLNRGARVDLGVLPKNYDGGAYRLLYTPERPTGGDWYFEDAFGYTVIVKEDGSHLLQTRRIEFHVFAEDALADAEVEMRGAAVEVPVPAPAVAAVLAKHRGLDARIELEAPSAGVLFVCNPFGSWNHQCSTVQGTVTVGARDAVRAYFVAEPSGAALPGGSFVAGGLAGGVGEARDREEAARREWEAVFHTGRAHFRGKSPKEDREDFCSSAPNMKETAGGLLPFVRYVCDTSPEAGTGKVAAKTDPAGAVGPVRILYTVRFADRSAAVRGAVSIRGTAGPGRREGEEEDDPEATRRRLQETLKCEYSAWTAWSACSAGCGAGTRSRSRIVLNAGQISGGACGHTAEAEGCTPDLCITPSAALVYKCAKGFIVSTASCPLAGNGLSVTLEYALAGDAPAGTEVDIFVVSRPAKGTLFQTRLSQYGFLEAQEEIPMGYDIVRVTNGKSVIYRPAPGVSGKGAGNFFYKLCVKGTNSCHPALIEVRIDISTPPEVHCPRAVNTDLNTKSQQFTISATDVDGDLAVVQLENAPAASLAVLSFIDVATASELEVSVGMTGAIFGSVSSVRLMLSPRLNKVGSPLTVVRFSAFDGIQKSNVCIIDLNVNMAPIAQSFEVDVERDSEAVFAMQGVDPALNPLTAELLSIPKVLRGGQMTTLGKLYQGALNADGSGPDQIKDDGSVGWGKVNNAARMVRYVPERGESGWPYFCCILFKVNDGFASSGNQGQVTINVNSPPAVPADPQLLQVKEGAIVQVELKGEPEEQPDVDGDAITYYISSVNVAGLDLMTPNGESVPFVGSLTSLGGTGTILVRAPRTGELPGPWTREIVIGYKLGDGRLLSPEAQVRLTVDRNPVANAGAYEVVDGLLAPTRSENGNLVGAAVPAAMPQVGYAWAQNLLRVTLDGFDPDRLDCLQQYAMDCPFGIIESVPTKGVLYQLGLPYAGGPTKGNFGIPIKTGDYVNNPLRQILYQPRLLAPADRAKGGVQDSFTYRWIGDAMVPSGVATVAITVRPHLATPAPGAVPLVELPEGRHAVVQLRGSAASGTRLAYYITDRLSGLGVTGNLTQYTREGTVGARIDTGQCKKQKPCPVDDDQGRLWYVAPPVGSGKNFASFKFAVKDAHLFSETEAEVRVSINGKPQISTLEEHVYTDYETPVQLNMRGFDFDGDPLSAVVTAVPGYPGRSYLYRTKKFNKKGEPYFEDPLLAKSVDYALDGISVWFVPAAGEHGDPTCCLFPSYVGAPACADHGIDPYELRLFAEAEYTAGDPLLGNCGYCGPGKSHECGQKCASDPTCSFHYATVAYRLSDGRSLSDQEARIHIHVRPPASRPQAHVDFTVASVAEANVTVHLPEDPAYSVCQNREAVAPEQKLNATGVVVRPEFLYFNGTCGPVDLNAIIVDGPHLGDLAAEWLPRNETPAWNAYAEEWYVAGNLTTEIEKGQVPQFMADGAPKRFTNVSRTVEYAPTLDPLTQRGGLATHDNFTYALIEADGRVLANTTVNISISYRRDARLSRYTHAPVFAHWLEPRAADILRNLGANMTLYDSGWTSPKRLETMRPYVYRWGRGTGNSTDTPAVLPLPGHRVVSLAAAGTGAVGVSDAGRLVGVLSAGADASRAEDLAAANALLRPHETVAKVVASERHAVALTSDGRVLTWGDNSHGQLGLEHLAMQRPAAGPRRPGPGVVGSLAHLKVVDVACGSFHTLALAEGGQVFAWGSNKHGQLGLTECDPAAERDELSPCLLSDRTAPAFEPLPRRVTFAWNFTYADRELPGLHYDRRLAALRSAKVFAGPYTSFSVSAAGRLYSWGRGDFGQLGHGPEVTGVRGVDGLSVGVPQPLRSVRHVRFHQVAAGLSHTAAVTEDGSIYTWGSNLYGQLGHGDFLARPLPARLAALHGRAIQKLAVGLFHTAALDDAGQVHAWGLNVNEKADPLVDLFSPEGPAAGSGELFWHDARAEELLAAAAALPDTFDALGSFSTEFDEVVLAPRQLRLVQQVQEVAASGVSTFGIRWACAPGTVLDTATGNCVECAAGFVSTELSIPACSPCLVGEIAAEAGQSECRECPPGSFGAAGAAAACTPCPAGTFSAVRGAGVPELCIPCRPGTYTAEAGSTGCAPCGAGEYQDEAGATACKKCPGSTFLALAGAASDVQCQLCPAGSISVAEEGSASCRPCPAGTFSAEPGSAACTPCPPGTFGELPGAVACTACPAGTFQPKTGSRFEGHCLPCEKGYFSNSTAASTCEICEKGSFSGAEGATHCELCPPGRYGLYDGATSVNQCPGCPQGTFSDKFGTVAEGFNPGQCKGPDGLCACELCAMGTYSALPGSTECTPCPAGMYGSKIGAEHPSFCYECDQGTFTHEPGMAQCLQCPPGTHVNTTGNSECEQCPPGTFIEYFGAINATECEDCPIGSFAEFNGTGFCELCRPGTYSPEPGATECLNCTVGTYLPTLNGTALEECLPCGLGTYGPTEGLAACLDCPEGHYADRPAMIECSKCKAGTVLPTTGSNSSVLCEPCEPGTIAPEEGMGACQNCSAGYYQELYNQAECDPCDEGTYLPKSGSFLAEDCLPCPSSPFGTYGPTKGLGECLLCAPGSYADEPGLEACKTVNAGFFLARAGSNTSEDARPCEPGSFAAERGLGACDLCGMGTYAEVEGLKECAPCPAGMYNPIEGATSPLQCRLCGMGTRSEAGSGVCTPCSPGTFNPEEGQEACQPCPAGTFNELAGMIDETVACIPCQAGLFNDLPGKSVCRPCPKGMYGNLTRMTECFKCPAGMYLDEIGSQTLEECKACLEGTYTSQEGSELCILCPKGTYNEEVSQSACRPCPPKTYGQEMGRTRVDDCDTCPRFRFNTQNVLDESVGFVRGAQDVQDCFYQHQGGCRPAPGLVVLLLVVLAAWLLD